MVRVALLLESEPLRGAEAQLLQQLLETEYVEVALVAVVKTRAPPTDISRSTRTLINWYRWMDHVTRGANAQESARPLASYAGCLAPATIITVASPDELTAALTGRDLEVIVCPSPIEGMRDCAGCAAFGVWWIGPPKGAAALQELYATATAETPLLAVLWASTAAHPEPFCLEFGCVPLISGVSVVKNLQALTPLRRNLWLGALNTLSAQGWDALRAKGARLQAGLSPRAYRVSERRESSATAVARTLVRMGLRQLRHRIRQRNRVEHWRVGVRPLRDNGLSLRDTKGYRWLAAPPGHWYADPFVLSVGATELLYMEEFDERRNKGRIVCAELDARGQVGAIEPALERPYHVAYPCVFEHDNQVFMIPETGFNNTVELYRSISLPFQWQFVRVLYTGPAFDTSVLQLHDRFWFFTSLVEGAGRHATKLLLFHSNRVDGEWIAHPANPISHDAHFARGGGRLFRLGSQIVRPAQDGSGTYGGAVQLRGVQALNETEYVEAPVGSIIPARLPNAVGLHTYNSSTRMEVIDCRLRMMRR